jgi:hypothetical protein
MRADFCFWPVDGGDAGLCSGCAPFRAECVTTSGPPAISSRCSHSTQIITRVCFKHCEPAGPPRPRRGAPAGLCDVELESSPGLAAGGAIAARACPLYSELGCLFARGSRGGAQDDVGRGGRCDRDGRKK